MSIEYISIFLFAMTAILSAVVICLLFFIVEIGRQNKDLKGTNRSLLDLVKTYEYRDQLVKERDQMLKELDALKQKQADVEKRQAELEIY